MGFGEMGVVAERMVARASEALVKRDRAIVAAPKHRLPHRPAIRRQ